MVGLYRRRELESIHSLFKGCRVMGVMLTFTFAQRKKRCAMQSRSAELP